MLPGTFGRADLVRPIVGATLVARAGLAVVVGGAVMVAVVA